jgi:hypothetical protein
MVGSTLRFKLRVMKGRSVCVRRYQVTLIALMLTLAYSIAGIYVLGAAVIAVSFLGQCLRKPVEADHTGVRIRFLNNRHSRSSRRPGGLFLLRL